MNLIAYREKHNLTQKELSEITGISVRTIQRIESGVPPKGYTLKTLNRILEKDQEELFHEEEIKKEYTSYMVGIINFSSLFFVFIPILNFVVPILIARLKKQNDVIIKKIIAIQILHALLIIVVFLIGLVANFEELGRNITIGIMLVLILLNTFIILRNGVAIQKTKGLYFDPGFYFF
ncbi:helix-turn-helix domain-containing protein [Tenacibaculum sp. SG-28]|uniref:helix-turn-helix domain-containing protein n=1 Tax=Tenacibaculum sp. SG-28 TaxID=754426 RepID=UPI000CF3C7C1|nr:helix-turn-helix domain-containing protein [Tenacibaculum sp. SG-28]PQJ19643.1 hypothetical protein BSU00_11690 [Tenacibaculum sp. SG-28]